MAEFRRLDDMVPSFQESPIIDDPDILTQLMFLADWEQVTDMGITITYAQLDGVTYLMKMEE